MLPPPQPSIAVADPPSSSPDGVKRKRKIKELEVDESFLDAEATEVLRKKRSKSTLLSESLPERWEKGDMAKAMESQKATNAMQMAAKSIARAGGEADDKMVDSVAVTTADHVTDTVRS
jgi:hypothetical protein